ncbi:unnamed protein product [Triticum turgidum subsp. durum]|uniref:Major facilitator superfamily (MFS) profile domain-containing protein n=1 Tax=Triticum turgidum subsp. durum TaxID=4567 RepID=A0A9R0Q8F0_TRITD|nr:unnamed protein product [Triticum turgidum subsp. durum]
MSGAVLVAIAASIGNLLQGWDNATIAGAVLYIKKEFSLETQPLIEGLIVAMSLIGATVITTFSGAVADAVGRRPLLIASSVLYFVSGLVMLWAPNVYVLLLARLVDGFGIGLAVFYLPESPRWLVSKGRMAEAKRVLQGLRGREDVSGEMALLVEGLGVGKDTHFEEYIIGPDDELADDGLAPDEEKLKLYGAEEGVSWIARPVRGGGQSALGSALGLMSRHGSMVSQGKSLVDPLVTLFGSVHEKMPEVMGSMRSTLFPNFGSMFSVAEQQQAKADWDAESHRDDEDYASDHGADDIEDSLNSPLISRQATSVEGKEIAAPHGSIMGGVGRSSSMQGGEAVSSMGIGGGWQLAWKWTEREGADGQKEGGFQRIYLHEEGVSGDRRGSILSMPGGDIPPGGEYIQAAALVSQPALYSKDLIEQQLAGPAMVHPSEAVAKGTKWAELFEPGVKHALFVGIGLQILQQFAGINGVLYYTPQILEQAGVGVLLSNIGLSSSSASILISALTTLLMLPSIGIAMRLMDMSGRRFLLLSTIPVLIVALAVLVLVNVLDVGTMVHAALSTISVIVYFCFFVMGFGPIPNILCAEIFPTSVRGICIAICALTFWIGDIIVTYTLPVMLNAIGLAGVFGIYAIVCVLAFVFVYMKVPETKGMPLEVITEFFSVGAKQGKEATD